ncbi:MAG: hypothetical protein GC162_20830 [Planctomycetes bacterium]|nr:hypothetical protein [Planctomycetota bacterium]
MKITAALLAVLMLAAGAGADEIRVGKPGEPGISYQNIRVTGMRGGLIYFVTAGGEQSTAVQNIQALKLSRYPDYEKADAAMDKKDYAAAADLLTKMVDDIREDWLKLLVTAKLTFALDRSGQFTKAMQRFMELNKMENVDSDLLLSLVPQNLPEDKATRQTMAKNMAIEVPTVLDPQVREALTKVMENLNKAPGEAVMPVVTPGGPGGLVGGQAEGARDYVQEMIDKKDFDGALKLVDEQLGQEGASLSKLLYQRGRIQAAQGKDMDAAVSFMRVIIHFRPHTTEYYLPSLIEGGKVFAKLKQPDHARELWTEAQGLAKDDAEKSAEIEKLLGSVK